MSIETMTKLATVAVGAGGSATIDFTNIPQTYTDLVVKVSARSTASQASNGFLFDIRPNGSSANMTRRSVYGNGSATASSTGTEGYNMVLNPSDYTASTFSNTDIYIPNYTSSNYKSISTDTVSENNATTVLTLLGALLWSNTSAITSITLTPLGGNFVQHSTATLYGIRNMARAAGNSVKATGGNISFDGTYVVHTFTSSGTFTPTAELTDVDYLIVAGGGGGGTGDASGRSGGGGGAGGLRSTVTATGGGSPLESAISLSPNINYAVVVGGGGSPGASGGNSAFSTQFSTGGGGGGEGGNAGLSGGSGGGPSAGLTGRSASSGTAGQGYASGNTILSPQNNYISAGGGGAGAVGGNGTTGGIGGAGGAGVQVGITGSLRWYAAGGGGGVGQFAGATTNGSTNGIGGVGGFTNPSNTAATAGAQSTGSGGGGGNSNTDSRPPAAGAGGSGVVIIRYKA